ncbi:MAG: HNH endonuclease signature motif containing protein [Vulcanimicrobiaceae bacterium]
MGAITYPRTYGRRRGKWWQKRNRLYLSIAARGVIVVYKQWRFKQMQYQKRVREEYEQLRKEFDRKHRAEFLKRIAQEERDFLMAAGFGQADFKLMEHGRPPRGYQVHHKIPIDDGGDNSESNFLLIRNSPEHTALTSYQNMATMGMKEGEVRDLHFPVPEPRVFLYPPTTAPAETLPLWPQQKR